MINVQEVKSLLQLKDSDETYDMFLSTILPQLEEFVCTYTNQAFLNADGVVELPKGLIPIVAKMAQFDIRDVTVAQQSASDFRTVYVTSYPAHILVMLDKYTDRTVKFK
jgi:hypothetical protein